MNTKVELPPLPLAEWEQTKKTLHLFTQIVGKIRLKLMPYKNHWWHVPLYVNPRGIGTGAMPAGDKTIEINFDFCAHHVIINSSHSEVEKIDLKDRLCVADFYKQVFDALARLHVTVKIIALPYMIEPKTPFAKDTQHCTYQKEYVHNYWQILCFTDAVLKEFSGRFIGKCSPVHLFWHSFDLAVTRFSGRKIPLWEGAGKVDAEAYSHEVISAGFWPGDDETREAAFYCYAYPTPDGLTDVPLLPAGKAKWVMQRGSPQARYNYDDMRAAADPKAALMQFLESAYVGAAKKAGWDMEALKANVY